MPARDHSGVSRRPLAWSAIVLQLGWLYTSHRPLEHRQNKDQIADISTLLQLVQPDEYVMDPVAGAVYRQRPYFYALETITKTRIRFHLTEDNIRQRLIDTGTKVAMPEGMWHFSKSREFVDANYVPLKDRANIRVAGKYLVKDPTTTGTPVYVRCDHPRAIFDRRRTRACVRHARWQSL